MKPGAISETTTVILVATKRVETAGKPIGATIVRVRVKDLLIAAPLMTDRGRAAAVDEISGETKRLRNAANVALGSVPSADRAARCGCARRREKATIAIRVAATTDGRGTNARMVNSQAAGPSIADPVDMVVRVADSAANTNGSVIIRDIIFADVTGAASAAIAFTDIGLGLGLKDTVGDIITGTVGHDSTTVDAAASVGPTIVDMKVAAPTDSRTAVVAIGDLCDTITAGSGFIDGSRSIARSTGGVRTCMADLVHRPVSRVSTLANEAWTFYSLRPTRIKTES